MLGRLGPTEILVILAVGFLFFGPKKLPQLGKSFGETISEFKNAAKSEPSESKSDIELVKEEKFGQMVSYRHPHITSVPIKEAIESYNFVNLDHSLIKTANGIGLSLGI